MTGQFRLETRDDALLTANPVCGIRDETVGLRGLAFRGTFLVSCEFNGPVRDQLEHLSPDPLVSGPVECAQLFLREIPSRETEIGGVNFSSHFFFLVMVFTVYCQRSKDTMTPHPV